MLTCRHSPTWALALLALFTQATQAQEILRPDLNGIGDGAGWTLVNRGATVLREGDMPVVSFDGRPGDGVAWLDGSDFGNGTIEVRIRGKNVPQRSFVGIAFRGLDDATYDAVYFRPFNFRANNELSRSHSVQYISHPEHTWSKLREERAGEYESSLPHPPDPDGFFRVRIVVQKPVIRVFLDDEAEPCLVVNELSERMGGRIGLWMGNNSDGDFAELVLRPINGWTSSSCHSSSGNSFSPVLNQYK